MPRYTTSGLPPEAANGATAFMPHFNRLAASGAMSYKSLTGGPAQYTPVPDAGVNTVPSPDLGDIAQMGLSRTTDAPLAFWPDIYVAHPEPAYYPGAGMPVQVYDPTRPQDTTMIPVPAVSLRAVLQANSARLAMGVNPGGQRSIAWPGRQAWQRWKHRDSLGTDNG